MIALKVKNNCGIYCSFLKSRLFYTQQILYLVFKYKSQKSKIKSQKSKT